jgi:predicted MFS family arabinose efflux permease
MSSLFRGVSRQHLEHDIQQSYQRGVSWLTVWAAFAFATLVGFSRLSYGLLLPALRANLGGSFSVLGTLATVNFVGYLLGTLVIPILLARAQNRVRLGLLALLATNVLMIVSASSLTIWQLGIWRLLIGFVSAIATVLTMALTLERIDPQERGRASGIIWMGAALGLSLSGFITPPIISAGSYGGWRLVWIVMGLAGVVAALGLSATMRSPLSTVTHHQQGRETGGSSPGQRPLWATLRPLFLPQCVLWLTLSFFGFGGGYITYFTFFISLLEQQGVPSLYAGFVWAAIGLAAAVSATLWGRVLDRWPTGFTLAIPLAFGVCGSLVVLTNIIGVEYGGAALVGLSALLGPPLMVTVLLKRAVPDQDYAVSYSVLTAIFAVGQILGPLMGGFVIEKFSLQAGIATSALLLGVATLCACLYGVAQRNR